MKEQIAFAINIGCPLLQALHMIDMIVGFRYRANRHHWTSPEADVIDSLKHASMLRLKRYGYMIIVEDFFDYFELNEV